MKSTAEASLRMVDPDRPDFAGRDRYRAQPLHALTSLISSSMSLTRTSALRACPLPTRNVAPCRQVATQRGLVADHDRVDVAVAARERDGGLDFPLVAGLVLVDPDAERDLEPELGGNRRHQLDAAGRAVGADGVGVGAEKLQVGADLLRRRTVAVDPDAAIARKENRRCWRAAHRYWRPPVAAGAGSISRHARRRRAPPQQRRSA